MLVDGSKIVEVAASIDAPDAAVIDATGFVVMPGFIDAHSHQFETALRSFLADGILINDGRPESAHNYYELILQKLSMGYRPPDVYINELFAGIAQIDAGVTAVMDSSQIHHSPEHSDAAIEGLRAGGRRAVFGYFEGRGEKGKYPGDARRKKKKKKKKKKKAGKFGPDCFFVHMTGMSEIGWKAAADAGAHVTLAVPIEMQMRHGTPPIEKALDLKMSLSLSTAVECTMTVGHVHPDARRDDFATHVRQRARSSRQGLPEAHVG